MVVNEVVPTAQSRSEIIDLQIDSAQSLEMMLTLAKLDIVGHAIEDAELAPRTTRLVTVTVWPMVLTRLVRQTELEDIVPVGWMHANIEHQLTYARTSRQRQRDASVLAYGSKRQMNGWTFVPCLDLFQGQRRIRYRSDATYSPGTVVLLVKRS